jgi:MFS family permease
MQQVAQSWLIYDLTGSAFLVGLNGLIRTLPFLGMSLYAGTVVDRVDRKRLLFWAEVIMLGLTLGLAVLIAGGWVQVWHIYAFSIVTSLVGAFENPAQQALLPHLVPRRDLMTAVSLNSMVRRGSQVIGPALGGLSVAAFGIAATYFINVAAYGVLVGSLALIRATNPPGERNAAAPWRAVVDGLRYVRGDVVIGTLLLLEATFSVASSFNTILVVFARDVFAVGPQGLGLLQGAPGVGTILGSLALSALGDVRRKGRLIIVGGIGYGILVMAFALCPWFPLALVLLAASGAADILMGATRNTLLQLFARGPMLGRVMSLHAMATRGLGGLGGFQAGTIGSLVGVPLAVAMGGLVCIAATLGVAWRVPEMRDLSGTGPAEIADLSPSPTPARGGSRPPLPLGEGGG